MTDIINWFTLNGQTILEVLGALVAFASVITALTSTPVDDSIVSWVRKVLGYFSGLTFSDAPGSLSLPGKSGEEPLMFERTRL